MPNKTILALAATVIFGLGGAFAAQAEAASPFGPSGLGANLHRRFIIKQAIKTTKAGGVARNRQIIRLSRPHTYRSIRTRRAR